MNKNEQFYQETMVDAAQLSFLESAVSAIPKLVEKKEDGGFRITDFPRTVESPNTSLHIDKNGKVTSGHNKEEVMRILTQIKTSIEQNGGNMDA